MLCGEVVECGEELLFNPPAGDACLEKVPGGLPPFAHSIDRTLVDSWLCMPTEAMEALEVSRKMCAAAESGGLTGVSADLLRHGFGCGTASALRTGGTAACFSLFTSRSGNPSTDWDSSRSSTVMGPSSRSFTHTSTFSRKSRTYFSHSILIISGSSPILSASTKSRVRQDCHTRCLARRKGSRRRIPPSPTIHQISITPLSRTVRLGQFEPLQQRKTF
mmetsp:Transcript_8746/g.19202  ORF Transcript_8746/g.19202 Transcript_8746/m.19202 type:complete len:219 (+) Transcript_8746:686-1342(+)